MPDKPNQKGTVGGLATLSFSRTLRPGTGEYGKGRGTCDAEGKAGTSCPINGGRGGEGCAEVVRGKPHAWQKRVPGLFIVLQRGHCKGTAPLFLRRDLPHYSIADLDGDTRSEEAPRMYTQLLFHAL